MMRLPDMPSDLITLALEDLIKVEATEQYEVRMSQWHCPSKAYGGDFLFCQVCFAGAVMAMTLRSSIVHYCDPMSFDEPIKSKLHALECFRLGNVEAAFSRLGKKSSQGTHFNREIPEYGVNQQKFKSDMRKLAQDLKGAGL